MEKLKRCPHCAEEILAAAVKCKHCASNIKRPLSAAQTIITLVTIFFVVWLLSISSSNKVVTNAQPPSAPAPEPVAESPSEQEPTPELPSLSVKASINGELISIKNNDKFAWQDCVAKLNPAAFSFSSFSLTLGDMKAGHPTTIAASDFTLRDGERFNPLTHEIQSLYVSCTTPNGQQSWLRKRG